jgi:hypothetical protein
MNKNASRQNISGRPVSLGPSRSRVRGSGRNPQGSSRMDRPHCPRPAHRNRERHPHLWELTTTAAPTFLPDRSALPPPVPRPRTAPPAIADATPPGCLPGGPGPASPLQSWRDVTRERNTRPDLLNPLPPASTGATSARPAGRMIGVAHEAGYHVAALRRLRPEECGS